MVFPPERRHSAPDASHVMISVNPKAGFRSGQSNAEKLVEILTNSGFSVDISADIEWVATQASQLSSEKRLRAIVAAGGDGTVSLIAKRTPVGTPIAILPQGTENLLAKYLRIAPEPEDVARLIEEGEIIHLDAGLANGKLFLIMLGCGFDAEVVRRLDERRSGHIHHFDYARPILQSIFNYDYPDIRIIQNPESEMETEYSAKWVFLMNLPRYAVGLQLDPSASGIDQQLNLCAFREGSFLSGLTYLTGVLLRQHEHWEDCIMSVAPRFRLEADKQVPYQIDGDPGGFLPVDVEVLSGRLSVYAPRKFLDGYK